MRGDIPREFVEDGVVHILYGPAHQSRVAIARCTQTAGRLLKLEDALRYDEWGHIGPARVTAVGLLAPTTALPYVPLTRIP